MNIKLPELSGFKINVPIPEPEAIKAAPKHNYETPLEEIKYSLENQIPPLKDLAESAKYQADAANRQVIILEQQLTFVKLEAESSKKDAKFSKIVSVISIVLATGSLIVAIIALL